jgi:large subunit ribosomal protein L20
MVRVKRGVTANRRRRNILKQTKGYMWGRKSKERAAKDALTKAWNNMFIGRKQKKRNFRALWNVKINAAVRGEELNYSKFIDALKKKNVELDRKILADLAEHEPDAFKKIVEAIK